MTFNFYTRFYRGWKSQSMGGLYIGGKISLFLVMFITLFLSWAAIYYYEIAIQATNVWLELTTLIIFAVFFFFSALSYVCSKKVIAENEGVKIFSIVPFLWVVVPYKNIEKIIYLDKKSPVAFMNYFTNPIAALGMAGKPKISFDFFLKDYRYSRVSFMSSDEPPVISFLDMVKSHGLSVSKNDSPASEKLVATPFLETAPPEIQNQVQEYAKNMEQIVDMFKKRK